MVGSITATEATSQILTSSEMNEHDFDNEQIAAILDSVFGTEDWASKCAFYGVTFLQSLRTHTKSTQNLSSRSINVLITSSYKQRWICAMRYLFKIIYL